tara:strand:+ start:284 stop:895 length:612 start_codon:yes stop_codon:yes gene_type:complete
MNKITMIRIVFTALFLILTFQTITKADDISEFEIEGISIGDSLFDHITKVQFKEWEQYKHYYKGNKFAVTPCLYPAQQYDQIGCTYKLVDDENYKIFGINGTIKYPDNIKDCLNKKEEVSKEFKNFLKDTTVNDYGTFVHGADLTGDSKQTVIDFNFKNGGYIRVACHDWSNKLSVEKGWTDEFKVFITSKELEDFINNEAYN